MNKRMGCPYCDGYANLENEIKELSFRKDQFNIDFIYYKCEKCKEGFTITESDTLCLTQLHDLWKLRYNTHIL